MLDLTAADNGGDSPSLGKPVSLHAQCDKEGSGASSSTGELVVINTFRKRRSSKALSRPAQHLKRAQCLPQGNTSDAGSACPV